MFKNKLYNYFTKEFIKNFFIVLVSLSLLMLLTQAAKFLNIITEMGNSSEIYLKFMLFNYPRIIEKALPLSFLISFFFTISKLRNDKELNIFWYSGISKSRIFKIFFLITFVIFLLHYSLSIFFGPYSASKARKIIASSEFTMINSLIKEKNFNSPLKNLTIYVDYNNQKGDLKKIFIFETERTISAKSAKVLKDNKKIFLELYDGISQEKNNNSFNTIKFKKLIFDFSKFTTKNLKVEKFSEKKITSLIKELDNTKNNDRDLKNLRYEINKRLIKPFFIFILCSISFYIVYAEEDKRYKLNLNYLIFIISFLSLVLNEILLGFSSKNFSYSLIYFLIIILISFITFFKHAIKK